MPDLLHQTCSGNKTRKQMGNDLVLFSKKKYFSLAFIQSSESDNSRDSDMAFLPMKSKPVLKASTFYF